MAIAFPKQPPVRVRWGVHDLKSTKQLPRLKLIIGVTDAGEICRVDFFTGKTTAHLRDWKKHWPESDFVDDAKAISTVAKQIAKKSSGLHLLMTGTPFQQSVWRAIANIAFGKTATYADIAKKIGKPKAVRAVGTACGRNPIPLIVPCHRVVGSNGGLGGFSGGLPIKKALLRAEGIKLAALR